MASSQIDTTNVASNRSKVDNHTPGGLPSFLRNVPRPLAGRAFKQPAREVQPAKEAQSQSDIQPPVEVSHVELNLMQSLMHSLQEEPQSQSDVQSEKKAPSQRLPAVVSVKKSHRGCAVVILRDESIIERCALQRVAVIDGVCVEMKRHSKRSRKLAEGEEAPSGIFCAWGVKVERKVPISEEGIEEFFNSLSGVALPQGLVATPPFEESHISFPLVSDGLAKLSFNIEEIEATKDEILSSRYCDQSMIQSLWSAKDRMDALWNRPPPPMARSLCSRVARSQLFPHSGEGGQEHENRAGDKLAQISEMVGLLDGIPEGAAFLDLCGGPGAWSQHLLEQKTVPLRGFGFTLKAASGVAGDWQAEVKDEWYEDLYQHPNWTALWGLDGTGDLLKTGNLEHCVKGLSQEHVLLVVADGGFSDETIPAHLQELFFYRLLLAELLTAASCLSAGGKFVCKLYSAFSDSTAALLFLATQLFDSVSIVKPISSKATGPERYLAASGFREDAQTSKIRSSLFRSHALGAGCSPLTMPLLTPAVSAESLQQDQTFIAGFKHMVATMCERQSKSLNAVVDRADFLEEMAMGCAVCTDPWARRSAPTPQVRKEKPERRDRRSNYVPTPLRTGSGWGWQ